MEFRATSAILESQMERNMENDMATGFVYGFT